MTAAFERLAHRASRLSGASQTFIGACCVVLVWLASGPLFGFSDTWQLVINTSTTIITNLLLFLLQNSQNRAMDALHIKLDEIIKALISADNKLLGAERFTEEQLKQLLHRYAQLAQEEARDSGA